ncbi:hypothetical protein Cgig2_021086 [Carnegiea gigantea]|uniref:Uncharacterized protein n=1 Tax=Carnegiea gigantea TaxID=171969 RepID=A0A9Q1GST0_9CARY|nr:hypothetical protein Cgig2_021086 [Carnegiea gigantea]
MAKYDKLRGESRKHHIKDRVENNHKPQRRYWRKKIQVQPHNNKAKKVRLSQEGPQESYILKGEVNSDFMDWLSRSLVCTSEEPRDLGPLASALICGFGECTKICSLSNFGYRLKIKEVGPSVQVIQLAHIPCSPPLAEAMDSNHEVVGFEELDDEVALEDDVECNERPEDNPFESIHTQSRTKTACFSQNGYSEEIFKTTQHLYSLEADAEHKEPEINDKQPLGFERNDNDNHVLVFSPTKEINVPPLGFESVVTPSTSMKVSRRNLQVIDRRVTRSQKKLSNSHSSSNHELQRALSNWKKSR